jgi:hypothetical protein
VINGDPLSTSDRAGTPGAALEFDGIDDFFTVPSLQDFSTSSWTIAAWVYLPEPVTDELFTYVLMAKNASGNLSKPGTIGLVFDSEKGYTAGYTPCNSPASNTVTVEYRAYDTWTHVAVVNNADTGELSIWINGEQAALESFDNAVPCAEQGPLMVGAGKASDGSAQGLCKGRLDDVALFGRALDKDEIQDLYRADL